MIDETMTTVEASERAGVSIRQLHSWANEGYLRPIRIAGTNGRAGMSMRWETRDVEAAAIMGAVSRALNLGPNAYGPGMLYLFACALAVRQGDAVGVVLTEGEYEVTVEVRHAG